MVTEIEGTVQRGALKPEFRVERDGKSFVLFAGLLDLGHQEGLSSITTTLLQIPSDANGMLAICQAVVTTSRGTFAGIGDAAPNSVAAPMRTALIRMAETRAKARALRDAVNIGVAALEELDLDDEGGDAAAAGTPEPATGKRRAGAAAAPKSERERERPAANQPPERQAQDDRLALLADLRGATPAELGAWAAQRFNARSWAALTTANREQALAQLERERQAVAS